MAPVLPPQVKPLLLFKKTCRTRKIFHKRYKCVCRYVNDLGYLQK